MILSHSGNAGDIVYSIPTINHLTGGNKSATLYIKKAQYIAPYGDQCEFVKDFLLQQDGVKEVIPFEPKDNNWSYHHWFGLNPDYDLDKARHERNRGRIHIVKRYFDAFGIKKDHTIPWVKIDNDNKITDRFALIHLTPRWNGEYWVDWKKVYQAVKERHSRVYFIGFLLDHETFEDKYGKVDYMPTANLLEMARLIRDCEALYCNQGVALTVAQGLGKDYWLATNYPKTNCLLYTANEHILNNELFKRTA